jgi:hypothetical protein
MAVAAATSTPRQIVDLGKPLYTIGIAGEILTTHTRHQLSPAARRHSVPRPAALANVDIEHVKA